MANANPNIKQMKIKTGVVKRLTKEKMSYEKEVGLTMEKIEHMKADGKDEYDIKKMGEVLEESKGMIPDTKRRLTAACEDLRNFMDSNKDLEETEECKAGQEALTNAVPSLES